jgi:hypothetical protein
MKYTSGSAFRQALETRLKAMQRSKNIPIVRLRKHVAFERFIARLQTQQPDTWILKGGLAMQLRLGLKSRVTKDIDLLNLELETNVFDSLAEAALLELDDCFKFEVGQTTEEPEDDFGGYRYQIVCLVDGRIFEQFHVEVGVADVLVEGHDTLQFDPILEFAGVAATPVPCYPITQQIAEKVHALTRNFASGSSSRGKDIVDILLLAGLGPIDGELLFQAIVSTFERRGTHPIPHSMPSLNQTLRREYARLADEVGLMFEDFDAAEAALRTFINPVLHGDDLGIWDGDTWKWA